MMNLCSTRGPQPLRRVWAVGLALVVLAAVTPAPSHALVPIGWNIFGGWATEPDGLDVGGGVHFGIGPIEANGYGEIIFIDGGNKYTINGDAHWTVLPAAVVNIFVGGGLGLIIVDPEQGDTSSDVGVNVVAGATLNAVALNPFGKLKWVVMDGDDPFMITFGIRF